MGYVLDRPSGYGRGLANGNCNRARMGAEALCALGRPAAVMPWLERYRSRMLPRGAPDERVRPERWHEALGRRGSFAAWAEFFAEELREASWPAVLDRWMARLAPGISAAAAHGMIRVGHAVRALTAGATTPPRRPPRDAPA